MITLYDLLELEGQAIDIRCNDSRLVHIERDLDVLIARPPTGALPDEAIAPEAAIVGTPPDISRVTLDTPILHSLVNDPVVDVEMASILLPTHLDFIVCKSERYSTLIFITPSTLTAYIALFKRDPGLWEKFSSLLTVIIREGILNDTL